MKLLSDLLTTDYGVLSLIVITVAILAMVILTFVAIAKVRQSDRQ